MIGRSEHLINNVLNLKRVELPRKAKILYSAANDPQTGNDPQIGPQMIPTRKSSPMWTANDPGGNLRITRKE